MGQLEIQDVFTPYFDPEREIEVTVRIERSEIRRLRVKRSTLPDGRSTASERMPARPAKTPPHI